jgi:ABC transporter with metal-binding/Fe-S-binding domain ATP-binding protein
MKLAALTSGGKDSLFAAYLMHSQGFEIRYLVTLQPISDESYMFHFPNLWLTGLQAAAMGVPILSRGTSGEKEEEVKDLEALLRSVGGEIEGVVTGAIASEYQKQRIDMVCEELGIPSFAPLWHKDPQILLRELLGAGFEVIITSVAAEGLDKSWLGRTLDEKAIDDLKVLGERHGLHLAGEGGEYETLVLSMPVFNRRFRVLRAHINWHHTHGVYEVRKVDAVRKVVE